MDQQRFRRNPDVVFRVIGDEMLLVPIRNNIMELKCLFTLNETGAFIWQQLENPRSNEELHEALIDEFDVTADKAKKDLDRFINELINEKCVYMTKEDYIS